MPINETQSHKLKITCPACSQHFSTPLPYVEISNALYTSVVTADHGRLTKCICGQAFVLIITSVQTTFLAQPVGPDVVEKVMGSRIVTPDIKLVG